MSIRRLLRYLFGMNENKFPVGDSSKAIEILKKAEHEYYSLASLSSMTGVAPNVLQPSLESNAQVRVSIIKDENGSPLYTLDSKGGLIKDVWKAVRHISYLSTQ